MAEDLGSAILTLRTDSADFDRGIGQARSSLGSFQVGVGVVGAQIATNLGSKLIQTGKDAIGMAMDFDASLGQIAGLVGVSRDQINAWKDDIFELSTETAQAPKVLADALYFITSSGFEGQQALDALKASAYAAGAGLGSTAVVADAVTSAMNAYAQSNMTADQAAGILTATVREGKGEADALAGSIGRVIPVASQMGVSLDQVGAAMAGMTLQGLDAEEAATALRGVLTALQAPTEEANDALESVGLSAAALRQQLADQGLLSVLQTLKTRFEGNGEAMANTFGNVRALTGVLSLVGENAAVTEQIFAELAATTGDDLYTAFDEVAKGPSFRVKKSLNEITVAMTQLGDKALPVIADLLEGGLKLAGALGPAFKQTKDDVESVFDFITENEAVLIASLTAIGAALILAFPQMAVVGAIGGIIASIQLLRADLRDLGPDALKARRDLVEMSIGVRESWMFSGLRDMAASKPFGWISRGIHDAAVESNKQLDDLRQELIDIDAQMAQADGANALSGAISALREQFQLAAEDAAKLLVFVSAVNKMQFSLQPQEGASPWGGRHFTPPDPAQVLAEIAGEVDRLRSAAHDMGEGVGAELGGGIVDGAEDEVKDLVPAVIRELMRLEDINGIIKNAIKSGEIDWSDVARLYELGAIQIAEDFTDALTGKVSDIGAKIWIAAFERNRAEAFKAGIEAAEAYKDAFKQGIDDLESAIEDAFGAIDAFTGTRTVEDAQLELEILLAEKEAERDLVRLEAERAVLLEKIGDLEEEAARQIEQVEEAAADRIARVQDRIAANEKEIGALQAHIERTQDAIEAIEDAAEAQIEVIRAAIAANEAIIADATAGIKAHQATIAQIQKAAEAQIAAVEAAIDAHEDVISGLESRINDYQRAIDAVEDAAAAQIDAVQAGISANEKILDSLQEQLKVKQDALRADRETLSLYERTYGEHQKLLSGLEGQLQSLQRERESAWKILGMAPGGEVLPPTLEEAARELKQLQDELSRLIESKKDTGVTGADDRQKIGDLQRQIKDAQKVFDELDLQAQSDIELALAQIDAQAELLAQDQELIDQVKEKIAASEEELEAAQGIIDATKEKIASDKGAIKAIQEAAADQKAAIQSQIDATKDQIDVVRTQIEAERDRIDAIRDGADAQVAAVQAEIDSLQSLIDATNNIIDAQEAEIDQIEALSQAQVDALQDDIDKTEELIDTIRDKIAMDEKYIQNIEDQRDRQIKAIEEVRDKQIAALEDQIENVDAAVASIEDHIQGLKDEQEARERDRAILQRQLELQAELLPTDWELLRYTLEQIEAAKDLRDVYERLKDKSYDARDAVRALNAGLDDLAALILQLSANPSLGGLFPSFDAGGVVPGPVGRPMLAVVHGQERILRPGEAAGAFSPQIVVHAEPHSMASFLNAAKVAGQQMAHDYVVATGGGV